MSRNVSKLLWGIRIFRFIESNKIVIPYMVKASALLATPYLISEACGYRDTESIKFSLQLGASFTGLYTIVKASLGFLNEDEENAYMKKYDEKFKKRIYSLSPSEYKEFELRC